MLAQWSDDCGNLYEAGLIKLSHGFHAYLKRWDKLGSKSSARGKHEILWQGDSPPISPNRLIETLQREAFEAGCNTNEIFDIKI